MLILIGVLPGAFALQSPSDPGQFKKTVDLAQKSIVIFQSQPAAAPATDANAAPAPAASTNAPATEPASAMKPNLGTAEQKTLNEFVKTGKATPETFGAFSEESSVVVADIQNLQTFEDLSKPQREAVRKDIYLLADALGKINKLKLIKDAAQAKTLKDFQSSLQTYTQYIPIGVKIAVAFALGLGTMVGWKRIVVTVGEKIGKAHLTYAQGASAELVAAVTILGASLQGWPVSTTHVLSSGIAGTMAANRSGLQTQTLINIVLAWVLTLPVCIFLGASLFSASLYVTFHFLGIR
jgi:PiT family inorganic phosphate transporter